jgi:uncharacterized radical SAM superfamily Fe-S cluster-containing enzyme
MKVIFLNNTESLCPICLKRVRAQVLLKNKKVFLKKRCYLHGEFEHLHAWDNPFFYKEVFRLSKKKKVRFRDTTIDITSECNMKCPFCFSFLKNEYYEPTISNLMKKIRKLKHTGGEIILYGGEPTLRKDLFDIVKNIKNLGLPVNIATNGLKLNKYLLQKLNEVKLDRIQLQFDSIDDSIYKKMRKREVLKEKLRVIKNIKKTNIGVTLFVVLMKGVNENQIDKIISFAGKNSERIRYVIFTAVSPEGAYHYNLYHLTNDEIMRTIENKFKISKEDFIKCTEFDITLSNFLYKIGKINRRNPASCEVLCYMYVKNSKLIPLNRLIDLEELSKLLDKVMKRGTKNRLKIALDLFSKIKKIKFNIILLPFLFQTLTSLTYSFLTKKPTGGKFKKTFGVVIAPSQNRYNIDYRLIKNCNLYADTKNGKFIPFCEKLIFSRH